MHQVLARKWRPKNFQELVGQQHVTQALSYALDNQHFHHAYLFTGTRGVGKTTIARIFAKSINCLTNGISSHPCGECEHCREIDAGNFPDLIEVDAASRTQVDNTRQLLNSVPYMPIKGRFKVYLIDEVHMLSDGSFNALLKTLEEPPEHVKFILATTDPQKIPATVISRCLQFQLKNMSAVQISAHLQHILEEEKIAFEPEALMILAESAQGSMRDGLSLLDQAIAYGQGRVMTQDVAALLGAVPAMRVRNLFHYLAAGNAQALRQEYAALEMYAPDYSDLLRRILYGLQEITIAQLQAQRFSNEIHEQMVALAAALPVELVQLWYQIATEAWQSLPYQPDAALAVEMMLLRMLALQPVLPKQNFQQVRPIDEAALQVHTYPDLHALSVQLHEAAQQEQSENTQLFQLNPEQENISQALSSIDNEALNSIESENSASLLEESASSESLLNEFQTEIAAQTQSLEHEAFNAIEAESSDSLSKEIAQSDLLSDEIQTETELNQTVIENEALDLIETDNSASLLTIDMLMQSIDAPKIWQKIIQALPNVNSLFAAQNTYPIYFAHGQLKIVADTAGQVWATENHLQQLSKQLSDALGEKIAVSLAGNAQQQTVFQHQHAENAEKQAQIKAQFIEHPVVQALQQEFDAQVDEESIRFLNTTQ